MVFIDGYIQEFNLENSPKNNFQIVTISEKSLSKYTINIDQPLVNNEVDIHTVNIAGILNPTNTFDLRDYNVEHSLSQTTNYSVQGQFKQGYDINNFKFLYPKNNINDSIIQSLNIDSDQLSQEVYFEFLQSGETIIDTIDMGDKLKVRMFGKSGKYAIYAFVDGKLYDNKPVSIVQIDFNKYTELDINLDKYDCKNFFLIAASVENKDYIYQSSKFVLE